MIDVVASASSSSSYRGSLPSCRRRHRLRRRVRRSASLAIAIVVDALVAATLEQLREAMMCFTRLTLHAAPRRHTCPCVPVRATPKYGLHNVADPRRLCPPLQLLPPNAAASLMQEEVPVRVDILYLLGVATPDCNLCKECTASEQGTKLAEQIPVHIDADCPSRMIP